MFYTRFYSFLLSVCLFTGVSEAQDFEISSLGVFTYDDVTSDQKLNDVWGYAADGKEYALVGVWDGFSILDVTTPSNIVEKARISGPSSVWRDIKTWDHYAYVSHDGVAGSSVDTAVGILIVDLNTLDSAEVTYTTFNYNGAMNRVHNIYIDENGVLYAFGSDYGVGGALMFDVSESEMSPTYIGEYNATYLHDGFARGDTLWGSSMFEGQFIVLDVTDKMNPLSMGSHTTPNTFAHNCWPSDDNNYLFTSDEVSDATFAAYDVSDLSNIELASTIQSSISELTIPHNTHFINDFIVNSYYRDGLQIVDVSRPDRMVEVGRFDCATNYQGNGFNGAWGAYPYLPSNNVLISDMEMGLFVVQPSYKRASFYEGVVVDITNDQVIFGAEMVLNLDTVLSDFNGKFLFGQREDGLFGLTVNFSGYTEYTAQIDFLEGQTIQDTIFLEPIGFSLTELEKSIELYPNPTRNIVYLNSPEFDINSYSIYGIDGSLVRNSNAVTFNGKIDVSILSSGLYLIELTGYDGVKVSKKFTVE